MPKVIPYNILLSAEHVSQWEVRSGVVLPPIYRGWLLEHNGGVLDKMYVFPTGSAGEEDLIQRFLGLMNVQTQYTIDSLRETLPWLAMLESLPIAVTAYNGILCVDCKGTADIIWYYDVIEIPERIEDKPRHFIARDIIDFIAHLEHY